MSSLCWFWSQSFVSFKTNRTIAKIIIYYSGAFAISNPLSGRETTTGADTKGRVVTKAEKGSGRTRAEEDRGVTTAEGDRGGMTAEEGRGEMITEEGRGMKRTGAGTPGRADTGGATGRVTDPGTVATEIRRTVDAKTRRGKHLC